MRELGIVEPLAVHPSTTPDASGAPCFILLDGHLRIEALRQLGATEALCLLSTDDEGFTYNRQINRLTKHRMVSQGVFRVLRKMKPMRQIETVEMMISANCFTLRYADMVLVATRPELLVEPKQKPGETVSAEDIARMEREMEKLYHDYRLVEDTLGETMLVLVVAKGYVARLLRNEAIAAYLSRFEPDLGRELAVVMEAVTADARSLERE
ncbi:hypothetical protein M1D96_13985 [Pseudomonas sp. D1-3]